MSVPPGQVRRSAQIARHGLDLLDQIHIHHSGEDELLWPRLPDRARPDAELVKRMQSQHADFDAAAGPVRELLTRWAATADAGTAAQLANTTGKLHKALLPHLDEEEEHILRGLVDSGASHGTQNTRSVSNPAAEPTITRPTRSAATRAGSISELVTLGNKRAVSG